MINKSLGKYALPDGFEAVSIDVYNNHDIHDDVSASGCPYIGDVESSRVDDENVWAPFEWMRGQLKKPMMGLFDATEEELDELSWFHFECLTDTALALDFEGYPEHLTYFSDEQWELNHEFQRVLLSERENHDSLTLEMSRMLRKPIRVMT